MNIQKKPKFFEAVVFFDDRGVCKEMFYPEFEALLDEVFWLGEFANQQMKLAYLLITPRLNIKSLVFFYLDFDERGHANRGWNLPLRSLADSAREGPDLGGGPVRMACRSNCPSLKYQMELWDPQIGSQDNHLLLLRDAVRRNNLGILVEEGMLPPNPPQSNIDPKKMTWSILEVQQQRTAALLGEHEIRLSQISELHEQELDRLKTGSNGQVKALQEELVNLRKALKREERTNLGLREQVTIGQHGREELVNRLRHLEQATREELKQLREQIEQAADLRIADLESRYKEQLSDLNTELKERGLREKALQQESERLHLQVKQLTQIVEELNCKLTSLSDGASEAAILERLETLGVMFVVYHLGVGHLTLMRQDIPRYQENPLAFAAEKCFVSEQQYIQWMAHYRQPSCEGHLSSGARCSIPLDRVETPGRFVDGDSNRCSRHKVFHRVASMNAS